jgi:hypothetical protein
MARKTNLQRVTKHQGLIQGARKHWSAKGPQLFGGQMYSLEQIIAQLQSVIDAINATAAAHAAWQAKVASQRDLQTRLGAFVRSVENMVRGEVGDNPRILADFGLEPLKKTGPRTTKAKLEMIQKAAATRALRHTMGKRQRRKIKGSV